MTKLFPETVLLHLRSFWQRIPLAEMDMNGLIRNVQLSLWRGSMSPKPLALTHCSSLLAEEEESEPIRVKLERVSQLEATKADSRVVLKLNPQVTHLNTKVGL
eukprot:TRINITY_DN34337_c0_g1_i1.p2 TRINITY_DN34337_c0_g1~~TRINITY_DN34337_c0_g1_i1.p2  ORF type:complete len:103 (-),score=15.03 TRINITY_DN34337_c0_g1_i1:15-323(-)